MTRELKQAVKFEEANLRNHTATRDLLKVFYCCGVRGGAVIENQKFSPEDFQILNWSTDNYRENATIPHWKSLSRYFTLL